MEMIKRYIKNNKGRFFTVLIFFIVFLVLFIWTNNNYNIYKSTIAKVISLENVYDKTEKGTNDIEEKYYIQTMVVKVKNGQYKGQQITLKNSYSSSMLMNEKYKKSNKGFELKRKFIISPKVDDEGKVTLFLDLNASFDYDKNIYQMIN